MAEDDSSVKVAVRIRPQIAREVIDMCRVCTTVMPGEPQVLLGSDKAFTYDYVFDTGTPQSQVYDTCVEGLVDGSLEGYNATVLAYGQTGSGKTYTMGTGFDVELDPDQTGIIPRSIHHMFDGITRRIETARQTGEPSPEFKVTAQFMELYNEEVIDLFEPNCNARRGAAKIHEDPTGSIYVVGVTSRPVVSADDALQCLRLGALSRTTASTDMNSQSSRSHAIFTLLVKQRRLVKIKDPDSDDDVPSEAVNEFETLTAKFHFVDLAGSERLKRTGATGERAREGISINCGLLALGNVISALGDKSKKALHIPYRDSKLTRLLQDSLGGNSQTVMIACVSPSDRDFMETLNTLKYANRARNIKNRVTINQDKSSRTITLLRQEIQQLQLELQEYKQGKRVVGEDGVESVNDMFHENMMLQTEINKMRTRVKAMQETIDALSSKNSQLLAEKATVGWITSGSDNDVTELIQGYLKEIEELRAKLLESESTCQQLRKVASRPTNRNSNTGQFELSLSSSAVSVIEEAKKELNRDREAVSRILAQEREKRDGAEEGESDGEDRDGDLEDSESDTDTEDKEDSEPQEEYGLELAELNSEINIKQKLIDELEQSQRRLHVMKQQYEDKLQQLMARIKNTQEERDKVLASYSGQNNQPSEKVRKVKDEYERKLTDMQKELKRLQSAQREHVKLLRNQSQHESQLRSLKSDLNEMKKSKVKLMNRMKEEAQRHKEADLLKKREIAQLRKASRRQEHQIRSLESDTKIKEALLRRKNEEVSALRRATRTNMSNKAAGRVGPRHTTARSKTINFSPKVAKQKWQAMEKNISKMALNKQAVAAIEREMERQITERERLSHELEKLTRQRDLMCRSGTEEVLLQDLDEQIENIRANIEYVQENIAEAQQNVVQVEEIKGGLDGLELGQGLIDVNEARYFIEKLYNMAVSQTYIAAQKELGIKEMEIKLNGITQRNQVQDELFQHVVRTQGLDLATLSRPVSSNSSNSSSRSTSPTDTWNGNIRPFRLTTQKARRRTALPSELLYAGSAPNESTLQQEKMSDSFLMGPPRPVTRVPSVPDSLRTAVKPSPVAARKLYDRQESTSPRLNRRAYVMGPGSLMSKLTGSMEQGLDASPPNSPPTYRRLNSKEENVFSRLTSTTTGAKEEQIGKGIISAYTGKVLPKSPLMCTHVAEGHSRAVLSLFATDSLLFSASKDRTVKVWDLHSGVECQSLSGHPNNVVVVKYCEELRLVFSVSSAYVKVWDLRNNTKCIKTLHSSGLTTNGPISIATPSRSVILPAGEVTINDLALNHNGTTLYTAAGDRVRVWDIRKYECTGKLSGSHQAAVMCLAVGKVSDAEDLIVTGSKDHFIKVFEVNRTSSNMFIPKMNLTPPHYDGIQSLALQGDILFSGSRDMCIKKWDLSRQELIQSVNNAHKDWVCGLTFMPGGQLLLSGCRGGTVKVWSADSCQLLGEMKAHSTNINSITTNSSHIFTASNDKTVRLWRLHSRYDLSPDSLGSV